MKLIEQKSVPLILAGVLVLGVLTACGDAASQSSSPSVPVVSNDSSEAGSSSSLSESVPEETSDITPSSSESADTGPAFSSEAVPFPQEPSSETAQEVTEMKMNVQVGEHIFSATLEDNAAAKALAEMMKAAPIEIQMRDYSGFEKVGSLGTSLPTDDHQTTTQAGDIVLYTGNQIVMFYGSNSWSYTRLGRIDDLAGWEEALGSGEITAHFSM